MKLVIPIPVPIIQNEKDAVLETSDCTPSIPVSESQDPGSYPEPISASLSPRVCSSLSVSVNAVHSTDSTHSSHLIKDAFQ